MTIKYPYCSFKVDHVLSLSRAMFIARYTGSAYLKGPNQVEMLNDCYDKCLAMKGEVNPPLPSLSDDDFEPTEQDDHSGDDTEGESL